MNTFFIVTPFGVKNGIDFDRVSRETEYRHHWRRLRGKPNYDFGKQNNLWMLHNAIAVAGRNITLMVLWNGEGRDGRGGTQDMVQQVEKLQARTIIIDTRKEFCL